jgi:hypothetical protein
MGYAGSFSGAKVPVAQKEKGKFRHTACNLPYLLPKSGGAEGI